ncbi:hypothetical protein C0J52_05936 [Blattella germanica]|nr:hypothetical protein C0J52_05936 [Blattella germanica]
MDIKGKNALVTGAATGIGLEYVKQLLENGAQPAFRPMEACSEGQIVKENVALLQHVAVCDLDVRKGENAVKELVEKYGKGKAIFIKCDVTNIPEFEDAFKKAYNAFKSLDIVINNAGILNDEKWELQIAINVNGVVRGTLLGLEYMGKDKGGKGGVIVNIASILGLQNIAGCPVYVGTKHAVVGISRSFGMPFHFDRTGVRVLTMCPGVTDTPLISEAHHRQPGNDAHDQEGSQWLSLGVRRKQTSLRGRNPRPSHSQSGVNLSPYCNFITPIQSLYIH